MADFDPNTMAADTLDKIELEFVAMQAAFERLRRLRMMIAVEFEVMRNAAERLSVHTEAEAATILKLDNEKLLARLRRNHNLPHIMFGRNACYTSAQIAEICDLFSVNKVRVSALKKAA